VGRGVKHPISKTKYATRNKHDFHGAALTETEPDDGGMGGNVKKREEQMRRARGTQKKYVGGNEDVIDDITRPEGARCAGWKIPCPPALPKRINSTATEMTRKRTRNL